METEGADVFAFVKEQAKVIKDLRRRIAVIADDKLFLYLKTKETMRSAKEMERAVT